MDTITASAKHEPATTQRRELSLVRLYLLRATYLLIALGEGSIVIPLLFKHGPLDRGVIASLLSALCLLCLLGVKYPRQMLPLLLFEFAWKTIWMAAFGLPQWSSGQVPPTFGGDFPAILFGVILMPLILPWGFVWRNYVTAPADRWR